MRARISDDVISYLVDTGTLNGDGAPHSPKSRPTTSTRRVAMRDETAEKTPKPVRRKREVVRHPVSEPTVPPGERISPGTKPTTESKPSRPLAYGDSPNSWRDDLADRWWQYISRVKRAFGFGGLCTRLVQAAIAFGVIRLVIALLKGFSVLSLVVMLLSCELSASPVSDEFRASRSSVEAYRKWRDFFDDSVQSTSTSHPLAEFSEESDFHDWPIARAVPERRPAKSSIAWSQIAAGIFLWQLSATVIVLTFCRIAKLAQRSKRDTASSRRARFQIVPIVAPSEASGASRTEDFPSARATLLEPVKVARSELGVSTVGGMVRRRNEDAAFSFSSDRFSLLVVADGCGGVPLGKEASELAVNGAGQYLKEKLQTVDSVPAELVAQSFEVAEAALMEASRAFLSDPEYGLRTTLIVAVLLDSELFYGYIGDGAIQVVSSEGIHQSLLVPHRPEGTAKNLLASSLGPKMVGAPVCGNHQVHPGDVVIIATDGVSDRVSDEFYFVLARKAGLSRDLNLATREVLDELAPAKDAGGNLVFNDNLTLGLIVCGGTELELFPATTLGTVGANDASASGGVR